MQIVNALIKPASGHCNMHCDYCFYCDEAAKRQQASYGFMTDQTLKNVIRKCVLPAERVCSIAIQGGEPTLCGLDFFKKAVEYAAHFNRKGISVQFALQTNGYAITEEWCRFFAEHHFLLGLSVDGTPEIHDKYRHAPAGESSYARILKTAALFEKHRVEYNILTVVHREVAENIKAIYRSYRENGWHYWQFITCLDPLGEERGKQPYSLLPETYGAFLMELFDLWYQDYERGNAPFIRQFENYIGILLGYTPESCEQQGVCGRQYVVEADGGVYPCDFYVLDAWRLGNFNENRLAEIDEKRRDLGFQARSAVLPEACRACAWRALCRGGCYRSRLSGQEENAGLNYFCQGYQMFFRHSHDRLLKIAEKVRSQRGVHP